MFVAGVLLLFLLPPPPALAQDEGVDLSCQSPVWRSLPLAKSSVSAAEYDPASRAYYEQWVLKNVLPPFVFACLAAALLAAFLIWRVLRLMTCVGCLRGPRLRGKAAADLLGARCMRWLRWGVALLAAGMVAGAGFGFSTIQPGLEPHGIEVYEQARAYATACVAQANSTVAAITGMGAHATFLRQRVVDLGISAQQPEVLVTIDGFQQDIASAAEGMQGAISDVQHSVLDRAAELQKEWQPRLDKLDVVKNAALYAAYVLIIIAALAVALGVLLSCPGLVSACLGLLLFMVLLAWAAVSASTVGLQVGSNGCFVVEQRITDALVSAAERQIESGEGILALVGVGDTLALTRYYFYGRGKNATEIVSDLTGLNIPRLLGNAAQTVAGLQQAAATLGSANSSINTLPENLSVLGASISEVSGNISQLQDALSYESFHPQYASVKQYACCDLLNFVGGLWLGLLVVGCCALPLTLAVFVWLGRMDKLEAKGCCHVYRRSDYAQQPGLAVPELPDKKPGTVEGSDSEDERALPPGSATLAGSLSLRQKFAAAGLLHTDSGVGSNNSRGSGGGGAAPQPDNADTFRIRAAPYHPQDLEGQEEQPGSPPSAPTLPSSARSLNSSRRPSHGPHHFGTWTAATPAAAPPSARGHTSRSAPGSTLNSARSGAGVALLPAVEALNPVAQAALSDAVGEDEAQQAQQGAAAADASSSIGGGASGSTGSASALRRAGQALARLRLLRRK